MKKRIFEIFKELTAIPRGSGNMEKIADYCVNFAKKCRLRCICDQAHNVIIYKDGVGAGAFKEPVILQGHLDMVCQKTAESKHDFLKNGPKIVQDGDFFRANGTTLGADNGIALALILAILESKTVEHPPIEAVFTSDEEIGMLGASALDVSVLKSKRMINIDSEEDDTVTVSCAGGVDVTLSLSVASDNYSGTEYEICLKGLQGGHSGVEIDKGRVNANILAGRILNHLKCLSDFRISEINGGDKSNAITLLCSIKLVTADENFKNKAENYLSEIKNEISAREPFFNFSIDKISSQKQAFSKETTDAVIFVLLNAPSGIVNMSAEISGLVETSLNLGVLNTANGYVTLLFSLRSNKPSMMTCLIERLTSLAKKVDANIEASCYYPPWEYRPNSQLEKIYCDCYSEIFGKTPKISAIHAGLECAVFTAKINGLSAISVGPQMFDVHTVNERLSISSTEKFTDVMLKVLTQL